MSEELAKLACILLVLYMVFGGGPVRVGAPMECPETWYAEAE